jgi:hypothetical protein
VICSSSSTTKTFRSAMAPILSCLASSRFHEQRGRMVHVNYAQPAACDPRHLLIELSEYLNESVQHNRQIHVVSRSETLVCSTVTRDIISIRS